MELHIRIDSLFLSKKVFHEKLHELFIHYDDEISELLVTTETSESGKYHSHAYVNTLKKNIANSLRNYIKRNLNPNNVTYKGGICSVKQVSTNRLNIIKYITKDNAILINKNVSDLTLTTAKTYVYVDPTKQKVKIVDFILEELKQLDNPSLKWDRITQIIDLVLIQCKQQNYIRLFAAQLLTRYVQTIYCIYYDDWQTLSNKILSNII